MAYHGLLFYAFLVALQAPQNWSHWVCSSQENGLWTRHYLGQLCPCLFLWIRPCCLAKLHLIVVQLPSSSVDSGSVSEPGAFLGDAQVHVCYDRGLARH
ncbi:monocarboxylate permease-like protein [Alternaria alternata]|nr:monocarboxylate permease-like protein [Alternaria alternata]